MVLVIVSYSSDVVWETKKRSRWRPLSVKQTDKLESVYKEYSESGPTDIKIVDLDSNAQVSLVKYFFFKYIILMLFTCLDKKNTFAWLYRLT